VRVKRAGNAGGLRETGNEMEYPLQKDEGEKEDVWAIKDEDGKTKLKLWLVLRAKCCLMNDVTISRDLEISSEFVQISCSR